jgi:hypothetical protein
MHATQQEQNQYGRCPKFSETKSYGRSGSTLISQDHGQEADSQHNCNIYTPSPSLQQLSQLPCIPQQAGKEG